MSSTTPQIHDLIEVVQGNCHVSDARHAGDFSLCVFLLKMREYYRWENRIPLSQTLSKDAVGAWLVEREQSWDKYEALDYSYLPLQTGAADPFQSEQINQELAPLGYVYSSGYGLFHKPYFVLAKLEQYRFIEDTHIYISSMEFARELVAPPAMTRGNTIFVRKEPLRRVIWEKIEEWRWKQDAEAPMAKVLRCLDIPETEMEELLDMLTMHEVDTLMAHELGERRAGKILGSDWEAMLHSIPRSTLELQIRAVRDHLADCLSTLPKLVSEHDDVSIHFYFANFSGMRREIFPEAITAYRQWCDTGDYTTLQFLIDTGKSRWEKTAFRVLDAYHNDSLDTESLCPAQH